MFGVCEMHNQGLIWGCADTAVGDAGIVDGPAHPHPAAAVFSSSSPAPGLTVAPTGCIGHLLLPIPDLVTSFLAAG